jgi:Ca2+-transporting ATPase
MQQLLQYSKKQMFSWRKNRMTNATGRPGDSTIRLRDGRRLPSLGIGKSDGSPIGSGMRSTFNRTEDICAEPQAEKGGGMDQRNTTLHMTTEQPWHELPLDEVQTALAISDAGGLSNQEAQRRLEKAGPNRLKEIRHESLVEEIWETVREPMQLLLLFTGVLYAVFGNLEEALIVFTVILFVIGTEVVNETRAKRAMAALSTLAEPTAVVRRDGRTEEIPAEAVVPGDVLLLQAGRRVPADGRLLEAAALSIDESTLTGEALPVEKHPEEGLPAETPLAERHNLVFAGTLIVRGQGTALVVATGTQSAIGHIASLAGEVRAPRTPLQVTMGQLSRVLVLVALGISILVPTLAWFLAKLPPQQAVLTGLSLAFATIPEELPVIISLVLALGAYRLSRKCAIVKRLAAVEALGTVTVIATDKTGTLTQNQMCVERIEPEEQRVRLLEAGVLCTAASDEGEAALFDPLEVALRHAAHDNQIDEQALFHSYPIVERFPFDTERKLMSVICLRDGQYFSIVKGAPEAVLARCVTFMREGELHAFAEAERQAWLSRVADLAGARLRILAIANRRLTEGARIQAESEQDLTFVGLVGFVDPLRPEAREAMLACQAAGIRPILITGDHPQTALAIAQHAGMTQAEEVVTGPQLDPLAEQDWRAVARRVSIFARTTPEHKLRLVQALQRDGEHVTVTGDGTNDAPALHAADIGVAMGKKGTDVAREAADVILADDNFATVVRAIEEGRALFANLRKGIRYYLAVKVALVSVILLPVLLLVPVPFSPVQIVLTELFMDVAASAAFISERPEGDLMHRPPRDPRTPFLDRELVSSLFGGAAGLAASVSFVYLLTWYSGADATSARTAAFVTWLVGHVLLAFNFRTEREPVLRLGLLSNRVMLVWAGATLCFVLVVTLVPVVQTAVNTTALSPATWVLILMASAVGTCWIELVKWVRSWYVARQSELLKMMYGASRVRASTEQGNRRALSEREMLGNATQRSRKEP